MAAQNNAKYNDDDDDDDDDDNDDDDDDKCNSNNSNNNKLIKRCKKGVLVYYFGFCIRNIVEKLNPYYSAIHILCSSVPKA